MRVVVIAAGLALVSHTLADPGSRTAKVTKKAFMPAVAPPPRAGHMSSYSGSPVARADRLPVASFPVSTRDKSIASLRREIFKLEGTTYRMKAELESVRMAIMARAMPIDAQHWTSIAFGFGWFGIGICATFLFFTVYRFFIQRMGCAPAIPMTPLDGSQLQPSAATLCPLALSGHGLRGSRIAMSEGGDFSGGEAMCDPAPIEAGTSLAFAPRDSSISSRESLLRAVTLKRSSVIAAVAHDDVGGGAVEEYDIGGIDMGEEDEYDIGGTDIDEEIAFAIAEHEIISVDAAMLEAALDPSARMQTDGVVRISRAINESYASRLHEFVMDRFAQSQRDIETGVPIPLRFSDVLSAQAAASETPTRWDLRLSLDEPMVQEVLAELLSEASPVGSIIDNFAGGSQAELQEPVSKEMGPTYFLLGTNTEAMQTWFEEDENEDFLEQNLNLVRRSCLDRGDATVFDTRILHAGGGNPSSEIRALFSVTIRPHHVDPSLLANGPAKMRPDFQGAYSIGSIRSGKLPRSSGTVV